jgi:Flp pilus assembly protein TadD
MELDPHSLLEGMALAGLAIGAEHGVVYLRSEYPRAAEALARAAALEPDNPNAWANLAVARSRAGDRAGAEEALRQVQRLDPARAAAMRGR